MAPRQGSGEAAAGVVVLLGQIFSIVLALAALSPVLARLPAAWRAACDRCGLAAVVARARDRVSHISLRSLGGVKEGVRTGRWARELSQSEYAVPLICHTRPLNRQETNGFRYFHLPLFRLRRVSDRATPRMKCPRMPCSDRYCSKVSTVGVPN